MAGGAVVAGNGRGCVIVGASRFLSTPAFRMTRRIAIVEDEPAIRANYADALRRHGYEVTA